MTGGTRLRRIPSPSLDETQFCAERPDTGTGFWRREHACVLPLHHDEGDHVSRDGTTFPRKAARRSRTVVTGSYVENMARRRLS